MRPSASFPFDAFHCYSASPAYNVSSNLATILNTSLSGIGITCVPNTEATPVAGSIWKKVCAHPHPTYVVERQKLSAGPRRGAQRARTKAWSFPSSARPVSVGQPEGSAPLCHSVPRHTRIQHQEPTKWIWCRFMKCWLKNRLYTFGAYNPIRYFSSFMRPMSISEGIDGDGSSRTFDLE